MSGDRPDVRLVTVTGHEQLEAVVTIQQESAVSAYGHIFAQPLPREEFSARWHSHRGPIVLALVADRPIGFVAWDGADLEALYVRPEAAGQGVGSMLLEAAASTRRLWVLEQNHWARSFYEHRGWSWSGDRQPVNESGDVMELLYIRRADG